MLRRCKQSILLKPLQVNEQDSQPVSKCGPAGVSADLRSVRFAFGEWPTSPRNRGVAYSSILVLRRAASRRHRESTDHNADPLAAARGGIEPPRREPTPRGRWSQLGLFTTARAVERNNSVLRLMQCPKVSSRVSSPVRWRGEQPIRTSQSPRRFLMPWAPTFLVSNGNWIC